MTEARPLAERRGLVFPDAFVTRHFFKSGLNGRTGRALELGCGSGANLTPPLAYGWSATGIDIDAGELAKARWNLGDGVELLQADLNDGLPEAARGPYDLLLAQSSLYYIPQARAEAALRQTAARLAPGAHVSARFRLLDDYRYGRGVQEEPNGYRLDTPETGEQGLFVRFYSAWEIVDLLRRTLDLRDVVELNVRFDTINGGRRVPGNSDLVVWGRTPG